MRELNNIHWFCWTLCQVAVIDINDERGKEVEKTLGEKYGTGSITFIGCDVSVESSLKGWYFCLW